ncbi:MAG TPA: terminase small subunit [Phycisphaerae bacterium]|nr:terminase small subunit [Phycisphaerae bacterium]
MASHAKRRGGAVKSHHKQAGGGGESATPTYDALTEKQRRFVRHYVNNLGNGTKAARDAGYSVKCAHVQASENLRKPKIVAALREYAGKVGANAEDVARWLVELLKGADASQWADWLEGKCSVAELQRRGVPVHLARLLSVGRTAQGGERRAVDLPDRLAVIDRLAKLLGLDAASEHDRAQGGSGEFDASKLSDEDLRRLASVGFLRLAEDVHGEPKRPEGRSQALRPDAGRGRRTAPAEN